jgi:hypothetical protein
MYLQIGWGGGGGAHTKIVRVGESDRIVGYSPNILHENPNYLSSVIVQIMGKWVDHGKVPKVVLF